MVLTHVLLEFLDTVLLEVAFAGLCESETIQYLKSETLKCFKIIVAKIEKEFLLWKLHDFFFEYSNFYSLQKRVDAKRQDRRKTSTVPMETSLWPCPEIVKWSFSNLSVPHNFQSRFVVDLQLRVRLLVLGLGELSSISKISSRLRNN